MKAANKRKGVFPGANLCEQGDGFINAGCDYFAIEFQELVEEETPQEWMEIDL